MVTLLGDNLIIVGTLIKNPVFPVLMFPTSRGSLSLSGNIKMHLGFLDSIHTI